MSAWTKFATQFFHNKQKQNPDYKFSQALKEASKVYKKNKGGSSKKQEGGNTVPVPDSSDTVTEEVEDINQKKYSFNNEANDFSEDLKGNLDLETLHNMIELTTGDYVSAMKKKFNGLKGVPDELKFESEQEVLPPPPPTETPPPTPTETPPPTNGGKKSKRKSKKAGKKSQKKQKKAKKAGSKKSKK